MWQVWVLPLLVYGVAFALAIPIGLYMARVFDGRLHPPSWLRWIESRLDTGPQNWKQYAFAFMAFNVVTFLVGFVVLTLQPYLPLNPDGKKMLGPTTIFQHGLLVSDEYQSAALLRRGPPVVLQPVVLHLLEAGSFADDRDGRPGGNYSRAARRQAHGQFLSSICGAGRPTSSCRSAWWSECC